MLEMLLGSAALGFGQSAYQNKQNSLAAESANSFNAEQAKLNRDFQERMSNSAYQRQMADMKSAGVNPMLSINAGGAQTPGGGSASAVTPKDTQMNVLGGISTALEYQKVQQQEDLADAAVRKTNTEIGLGPEEGGTNMGLEKGEQAVAKTQTDRANMVSARQNIRKNEEDIEIRKLDKEILRSTKQATADTARLDAAEARADLENLPWSMKNKKIQQGAHSVKSIGDAATSVMPKAKFQLNSSDKEELQLHRAGSRGVPYNRRNK
ncbi:MAG: DNA pilot protein [Microviridae sp.]|nr:MAG: DNA pilot protein [Microviridae sp.]